MKEITRFQYLPTESGGYTINVDTPTFSCEVFVYYNNYAQKPACYINLFNGLVNRMIVYGQNILFGQTNDYALVLDKNSQNFILYSI